MTTLACHSAAAIGVPLRAESWPSPQGLAHYRWTPSAGGKKDWRHFEVLISNRAAGFSPGARLNCLLRTSGSLPGTAAELDIMRLRKHSQAQRGPLTAKPLRVISREMTASCTGAVSLVLGQLTGSAGAAAWPLGGGGGGRSNGRTHSQIAQQFQTGPRV